LDACPRLRTVVTASAGYDHLALKELTERGIVAANVLGVLAETVADTTWALMLAVNRRIVEGDHYVRAGQWEAVEFDVLVGRDVYGARLGIVGYGAVGRAVARRAAGFNMSVTHFSRTKADDDHSKWVPLEELLASAEIVTIHVALNDATRGLISRSALALMKSDAIIVNTARGALIDQAALADALRSGRLRGAALDVFEREPLHPDDPLLQVPNLIVTPHIGSASALTRARTIERAAEAIITALKGEMPSAALNPNLTRLVAESRPLLPKGS